MATKNENFSKGTQELKAPVTKAGRFAHATGVFNVADALGKAGVNLVSDTSSER